MRKQLMILCSMMLACSGSQACWASVRGQLVHSVAAGLFRWGSGPAGWFVLPPSEPIRLIVMGLSLIGISLLVRRWASR